MYPKVDGLVICSMYSAFLQVNEMAERNAAGVLMDLHEADGFIRQTCGDNHLECEGARPPLIAMDEG